MTTTREREEKVNKIKKELYKNGITVKAWAEKHGHPVKEVYRVLNGERKGLYGRAHSIAKDLGLWK